MLDLRHQKLVARERGRGNKTLVLSTGNRWIMAVVCFGRSWLADF